MNSTEFQAIRNFPLHECLINPDWREQGHARVLVARKKPSGRIACAVFLIDLYCLGVKDVMIEEDNSKSKYEQFMKPMMYFDRKPITCDPHLGHTIIYGGINYARSLGFEPHDDFGESKHILMPESEITLDATVKFGKDGKPFYVQGPEDDVYQVLTTLTRTVGEGNFGFVSQEEMGISDDDGLEYMFESLMSKGKKN